MDESPIKAGTCPVVSFMVTLPCDRYARIESLARVLGVTVSHAASLTIYAGQAAQELSFVLLDDLPASALSEIEAVKRVGIIDP